MLDFDPAYEDGPDQLSWEDVLPDWYGRALRWLKRLRRLA